ncbi:copper chaperone PCu(A)C [Elongatibacter sediminis]|uniref:Copper chaperone PCu(A)C n=1 Tax=Elongatibacter sediminis TaxID=3119006 RepID=A0AAW9RAA0_9GAMM
MFGFLFSPVRHRVGQSGVGQLRVGESRAGLLCVCALLAALAGCAPQSAPTLELSDAWVRAMPPGAGMTAAYGELTWTGREPLVISEWLSDAHADVSLHRTVRRDGVSRMEAVPQPAIDPGESLRLEPGGLHLMLMKSTRPLQAGDSVVLTVISDSGRSFQFDLPVEGR